MDPDSPDFGSGGPVGAYWAGGEGPAGPFAVVSPWRLVRLLADRELAMCVYEATGGDWVMAGLIGIGVVIFGGLWLTVSRLARRR